MSPKVESWGTVNEKVIKKVDRGVSSKDKYASTQRTIAIMTAICFFGLILIPLIYLSVGITTVANTIELIKTIAAVLGGIVGMVWGFYFHKLED
jgi:hypothetical protein